MNSMKIITADKENLIDQQELTKLAIFLSTKADIVKRS